MGDRPPKQQIGFTADQRAAMRAVEEESVIDLVSEMVRRLNRAADRLEAFASTPDHGAHEGE